MNKQAKGEPDVSDEISAAVAMHLGDVGVHQSVIAAPERGLSVNHHFHRRRVGHQVVTRLVAQQILILRLWIGVDGIKGGLRQSQLAGRFLVLTQLVQHV